MSTPEAYNPEDAFHSELEAQEVEAVKQLDLTFEQKMAWFQRASTSWAQAAENRIPAVLRTKADQVTAEIKKIEAYQIGEIDLTEHEYLKNVQNEIFSSMQKRVMIMVEVAGMQTENLPVGTDRDVSSDTELVKLREMTTLIERIDVQQLVYNALTPDRQVRYLESVGRSFPADLFPILEKTHDHIELDDKDYALLVNEVRNLGANQDRMAQSSVMLVLGLLSQKERSALLQKMAVEDAFPNFEAVMMGMAGTGYVSILQVTEALDTRTKFLEEKKKTTKRREDKAIDKEIEQLQGTLEVVNSDQMKETQKAALVIRAEASKYYGTRNYGHTNFAGELLTVRGIGSLFLTANGAMTVFANVAMNATDPLSILSNNMVWLGAAEMGLGMQMSGGHGGLVRTPEERVAGLMKGSDEEKDDRMAEYTRTLRMDVNNYHTEAHFYANYAERIETVYKAKKPKFPNQTVPMALSDIGINKKEDLPPRFRDLWDKKDKLEAKISEWAQDFSLIEGEAGQKTTEWKTQRQFIEESRAEVSPKVLEYAPLEFFEYQEK